MMKKRERGRRTVALSLLLVLLAATMLSCQFPFDLNTRGTEAPTSDATQVPTEMPTEALGTDESTTPPASEQKTDEELEIVHPTEEVTEAATAEGIPEVEEATGVAYDVSPIVEAVMPAMVSITVKVSNLQSSILGGSYEYESEGAGSGIIVAQDDTYLYIVTNNHVVEGSKSISVCFVDGEECAATVKGTESSYDLAILLVKLSEMKQNTVAEVRIAKLGSSNELKLGQGAVAIGNALGYGQSVTVGCISALGRSVESEAGASIPLVQTDAAINPGNSGGALLNMKGEVIGINSMKYASTEVEGMGYAIPISDALPIMQALIEEKIYDEDERGYLGVGCTAHTNGLYVSRVASDSPAALAGLLKGDIITAVNGRSVKTEGDLQAILSRLTKGDTVTISYLRKSGMSYQARETTATLVTRSEA